MPFGFIVRLRFSVKSNYMRENCLTENCACENFALLLLVGCNGLEVNECWAAATTAAAANVIARDVVAVNNIRALQLYITIIDKSGFWCGILPSFSFIVSFF